MRKAVARALGACACLWAAGVVALPAHAAAPSTPPAAPKGEARAVTPGGERRDDAASPGETRLQLASAGLHLRAIGNLAQAAQRLREALALSEDAGLLAELGRTLLLAQDYPGALDAFTRASLIDKSDASRLAERGGARLLLGDQVLAQQDFKQALSLGPDKAETLCLIGQCYAAASDQRTALSYYEEAARTRNEARYHGRAAEAWLALAKYPEAQREANAALSTEPRNPEWLLLAGEAAQQLHDAKQALAFYRQAAESGGGPAAEARLARLLSRQDERGAGAAWEALVAKHPEDAQAYLERGRHYLDAAQFDKAGADFAKAAALEPQSDEAEHLQAMALLGGNDAAGAAAHQRRALELDPCPARYLELIRLLGGDPAQRREVERLWQELLERFPGHPAALKANAERLLHSGSPFVAAQAYARAHLAAPRDPEVSRGKGDCALRLGRFSEAAAFYREALEMRYQPELIAALATAYEAAGQRPAAESLWREYAGEYPAEPGFLMQYALARFREGDYPAALELFRRGQQADPGDPAFRNRAGTVLLELGRPAEAVPELEAALALRADPLYYYNLAQAHEALGDKAKAEQRYREGLKRCGSQPDLVGGLRRLLEAQGRTSELRGILLEAARGQQSPALYLEAAELALSEKDATAAEAAYKEALRLAPADPKVLAAFTSFLIKQRRGSQALELAKGAREALGAGGYLKLLSGMAETWVSRASFAEGIQLVAEEINQDPHAPGPYFALAQLQAGQGDPRTALATVKRGLNDAGQNYFLRWLEVELTARLSGGDAALELAQALTAMPGADELAYLTYLRLLKERGLLPQRLETARQGLYLCPQSAGLLSELAAALAEGQDYAGLAALLEDTQYAEIALPRRSELLGESYLQLGNYVRSVAYFAAALAQSPKSPALYARLGEAQYFQGFYVQARESLTAALKLDPAQGAAQLWLGMVLLGQQDLPGAQVALTGAAQAQGLSKLEQAWLALGQARLAFAAGKADEAGTRLDQAASYNRRDPRLDQAVSELRREMGQAGAAE